MASTIEKARLTVDLSVKQVGDNDAGGPVFEPRQRTQIDFSNGTGANSFDILWTDTRTLAASATEDLDLAGVLTDVFGATVAMAEVGGILITTDSGNTNNVVVGDATAPVPLFGGTNPTISVKPGGVFLIAAPNASGQFAVGAGATDDLKIANSGAGTSVTYTITILGRSA
jgi:hypothetical protein